MSDEPQESSVPAPLSGLPPQNAEGVGEARPITLDLPDATPIHPPRRPRVWTVFVMLVLAFLANAVGGGIYLYRTGAFTSRSGPILEEIAEQPEAMVGMAFWGLLAMGLVTWLGALLSPAGWRQRVRLTKPGISAGQIAAAAVGGTAIGMVFTMSDALGLLPRSTTLEALGEALSGIIGANVLLAVLAIGFMPGITEELLFRGYVQTRFSQRWGIRWSVFVTALLFGVYHLDVPQGMLALVIGLFLGAVVERANSIVPAIIAHAVNNSFAVLMAAAQIAEPESPRICGGVLAVSVVIVLLCIRYVWRRPAAAAADARASADPEIQAELFDPSREAGTP